MKYHPVPLRPAGDARRPSIQRLHAAGAPPLIGPSVASPVIGCPVLVPPWCLCSSEPCFT